jgi:DNA polymerase delta subunit 1
VLQRGTDADRKVLAEYCLKDALLPIQILEKKLIMFKYTEMCRVCSVPYSYLIERGQQVKVVAQILREAKPRGYVMDTLMVKHAGDGKVAYQGATVLEPNRGSYENIGVEDFQSLYPSTMIAHNLCYTTFLKNAEEREVFMKNNPEAYEISPIGAAFVRKERMEGLLPRILINLLDARAAAKKDLKNEKDPARKNVLDGRQNALKVSANSVYVRIALCDSSHCLLLTLCICLQGFTGALVGFLPCLEISASVTSFGREQLLFTKKFIEDYFTAEKLGEIFGRPFKRGAKIIYGDTVRRMRCF